MTITHPYQVGLRYWFYSAAGNEVGGKLLGVFDQELVVEDDEGVLRIIARAAVFDAFVDTEDHPNSKGTTQNPSNP